MSERVTNTKIKKTRKKRIALTIEQKIEILKKLKKGVSKDHISAHYNIHKDTINQIIRSRSYLFKKLKQGKNIKRKSDRSSKFIELNNKLYEWYQNNKSTKTITKELLRQETRRIATLTQTKLFNVPNYVTRFMKRYGISKIGKTNENLQYSLQQDDENNQSDENYIRELQLTSTRNRINNKNLIKQLYEWCQKQKASGNTINQQLLREAAFDIAKKVGEPKNMSIFLYQFKKRHNIVLEPINNSEIVQNSVQRDDDVNRSDENFIQEKLQLIPTCSRKNLAEQLFEWCQKRKESGDTINQQLLCEAALDIAKEVGEPSNMSNFLDQFIEQHNIVLEPINNSEILQNSVQRDDEDNQCNAEKFFQEVEERLKTGDIKEYNIYIMFHADIIWNAFVGTLLLTDENQIEVQQIDIKDLRKKCLTSIFCTNITSCHRLFPVHIDIYETNEYENQNPSIYCGNKLIIAHKLQKNILTKRSKDFEDWYNTFKFLATKYQDIMKKHKRMKNLEEQKDQKEKKKKKKNKKKEEQEKGNKLDKMFVLVDDRTQCIFSEDIFKDTDIKVMFLSTNLCSKLVPIIEEMSQIIFTYLKSVPNICYATDYEFNTEHTNRCIDILNHAWIKVVKREEIKELWENFLREYQT